MNLSINGKSQIPPGFRFHPTEDELLDYYLRTKVACKKIDFDVIVEIDLNKLEPWEIQEKCKIGCAPQNDWYFFSQKDKKYPTGNRTNRATAAGFWKATGRDKIIYSGPTRIGLRKTLVFYTGRAPHGHKSDWIMHEYRLEDHIMRSGNLLGEYMNSSEDGWVVCRVFRKKNYLKTLESPKINTSASMDSRKKILHSSKDEVLDPIRLPNGHNNTQRVINNEEDLLFDEKFLHLPRLGNPSLDDPLVYDITFPKNGSPASINYKDDKFNRKISSVQDWVTLDRLVASQLEGQVAVTDHPVDDSSLFTDQSSTFQEYQKEFSWHPYAQVHNSEDDLWSLIKLLPSPSS